MTVDEVVSILERNRCLRDGLLDVLLFYCTSLEGWQSMIAALSPDKDKLILTNGETVKIESITKSFILTGRTQRDIIILFGNGEIRYHKDAEWKTISEVCKILQQYPPEVASIMIGTLFL